MSPGDVLSRLKFNSYEFCHNNEYFTSLSLVLMHQAPEQDEVLQSIDRAIEGIHNVALKNGGKYNLEQRDVLQ